MSGGRITGQGRVGQGNRRGLKRRTLRHLFDLTVSGTEIYWGRIGLTSYRDITRAIARRTLVPS